MKLNYAGDVKGLPKLIRAGHNTRKGRPKHHIYKVEINDYTYYAVKFHRSKVSFSKYFKKRKEAVEFLKDILRRKVWQ
jgi:hypothetical protein